MTVSSINSVLKPNFSLVFISKTPKSIYLPLSSFSSLTSNLLKRSFCYFPESGIHFNGRAEVIPPISKQRSIELSRANVQISENLLTVAEIQILKDWLKRKDSVFDETDPSKITTIFYDHPERIRLYKFNYSKEAKKVLMENYTKLPIKLCPSWNFEYDRSNFQSDVLLGLLLGKGFIPVKKGSSCYSFYYVEDLEEISFMENIYEILFPLSLKVPQIFLTKDGNYTIGLRTCLDFCLEPFVESFYGIKESTVPRVGNFSYPLESLNDTARISWTKEDGSIDRTEVPTFVLGKSLPLDLEKWMNPRVRSYFFMSVGFNPTPDRFRFKNYAFLLKDYEKVEVDFLKKVLWQNFRIETDLSLDSLGLFPVLHVNDHSRLRLKRILLHYIQPSLLYKI